MAGSARWFIVFPIVLAACAKHTAPTQFTQSGPQNQTNEPATMVSAPTLRMPGRAEWIQAEIDCRAQPTNKLKDEAYQRFTKQIPHSPELLTNYAIFLSDYSHDLKRSEAIYRKAMAEPTVTGFTYSNYGNFVLEYFHDKKKAEALFKKALAMSPRDDTSMILYGLFLLESGKENEGQNLVDQAKRYGFSHNLRILIRTDFCRYSIGKKSDQLFALYTLRTNLVNHFRADNWDFSIDIERAKSAKHSGAEWLQRLADVCSNKADIASLKTWEGWRDAVRPPRGNTPLPPPNPEITEEDKS
jgi:tetratricopeptide (TPR) repeat protein